MFAFVFLALDAVDLAIQARRAALTCDPERARRLEAEARAKIAEAREQLRRAALDPSGTASAEAQVRWRQGAQSDLRRAQQILQDVGRLLELCGGAEQPFAYVPEVGTFFGSRDQLTGGYGPNRIRLVFRVLRPVECKLICLVSVQHFEDPTTGRVIDPPSQGRARSQEDNDLVAALLGPPPQDVDAVEGYVVDADPRGTDPCLPKPERVKLRPVDPTADVQPPDDPDQPDVDGVTVDDVPADVKRRLVAYFETAAVCVDSKPYQILASMRWRLVPDKDGLRTEILERDGRVDWGPASGPFQRALQKWLTNRGL